MAFARLGVKLRQAITDAEKTEMDPVLKQALTTFSDSKEVSDYLRDYTKDALPIVGSQKHTRIEHLGWYMKEAAAKYGIDKPESKTLSNAGETLMKIGKEERALLEKVEQCYYNQLKVMAEAWEVIKKEKGKLETVMTDMDGANISLKGNKDNDTLKERARSAKKEYDLQKSNVELLVASLPQYRDKQQAGVTALLQALRDFYAINVKILDKALS